MNAKRAKTKSSQNKKAQVKLQDLKPKKDVKGGDFTITKTTDSSSPKLF